MIVFNIMYLQVNHSTRHNLHDPGLQSHVSRSLPPLQNVNLSDLNLSLIAMAATTFQSHHQARTRPMELEKS